MDRGGTYSDRPIRVLLVDDQERVRRALRQLLEAYPDIDVVGEAASGEAAIEVTERVDPDVVLMDSAMVKTTSGLSATRELKRRRHSQRVVMLTMDADLKTDARTSGVDEFLVKGFSAEALLDTVRRVCGTTSGL